MSIEVQKAKADWVLDKLSRWDCAVAGGCPRDWYFGEVGKDIDVFIAGSPSKEELEEALGFEISPLVDTPYDDSRFNGFTWADEDGQEFQFLSYQVGSVEEIVEGFSVNMSQAMYKNRD